MEQSIMWEHINESKERLEDLLRSDQIDLFLQAYSTDTLRHIIFIASGSSYNIATVCKNIFEKYAQVAVKTYTPFEFLNITVQETKEEISQTLVIAISQTGTSSGTIDGINHAKSLGFSVLTMTERKETPVHLLGDYYLNFLCGLEDCNAKTKGYNNSLVLLQLLAMKIAKKKGSITNRDYEAFLDEIMASVKQVPTTIAATLAWLQHHKDWATISNFLMIGYGTNYGTAVEGMLKILETMCIPASICDIGEFSHGFHRTITPSSNIILIRTEEYGKEQATKTITYLKGRINQFLVVDASNDVVDHGGIHLPYHPFTCSSLLIAIVFQVVATYLPEVIGYDPNRQSNDDYTLLVNTRI